MQNRGLAAGAVVGALDHRGEDALVELDGRRIAVQVVTVPIDPSLWKHLSEDGVATRSGTREDAVQMIREAMVHKAQTAKGTLMALDVSHISAIVGPRLVETYHAAYVYDEFDLSGGASWVHRFLFWPYREVAVRVTTLTLRVTPVRGRFDESAA